VLGRDHDLTRALIASALARETFSTHSVDDILAAIDKSEMQLWPGERSVVVTQVQVFPRNQALALIIGAGNLAELRSMLPAILAWGRAEGCKTAFLVGRAGWARSFLARDGWKQSAIVMETEI